MFGSTRRPAPGTSPRRSTPEEIPEGQLETDEPSFFLDPQKPDSRKKKQKIGTNIFGRTAMDGVTAW